MCMYTCSQEPPAKKRDTREHRAESSAIGESTPEQYVDNLTTLQQEQQKEKPSKKTIRQLMKATYQGANPDNWMECYMCVNTAACRRIHVFYIVQCLHLQVAGSGSSLMPPL